MPRTTFVLQTREEPTEREVEYLFEMLLSHTLMACEPLSVHAFVPTKDGQTLTLHMPGSPK